MTIGDGKVDNNTRNKLHDDANTKMRQNPDKSAVNSVNDVRKVEGKTAENRALPPYMSQEYSENDIYNMKPYENNRILEMLPMESEEEYLRRISIMLPDGMAYAEEMDLDMPGPSRHKQFDVWLDKSENHAPATINDVQPQILVHKTIEGQNFLTYATRDEERNVEIPRRNSDRALYSSNKYSNYYDDTDPDKSTDYVDPPFYTNQQQFEQHQVYLASLDDQSQETDRISDSYSHHDNYNNHYQDTVQQMPPTSYGSKVPVSPTIDYYNNPKGNGATFEYYENNNPTSANFQTLQDYYESSPTQGAKPDLFENFHATQHTTQPDKSIFEQYEDSFYKPSSPKYPENQLSNYKPNPNDRLDTIKKQNSKYSTANYYYPKKETSNGSVYANVIPQNDVNKDKPPVYQTSRPAVGDTGYNPTQTGYQNPPPETGYGSDGTDYGPVLPETGYGSNPPQSNYGSQMPGTGYRPQTQENSYQYKRPQPENSYESNPSYNSNPPKPVYGTNYPPNSYESPYKDPEPIKRPPTPGYNGPVPSYVPSPNLASPPAGLPPPKFDFDKPDDGGFTKDHFTTGHEDVNSHQGHYNPGGYSYENNNQKDKFNYKNNGYNNYQNNRNPGSNYGPSKYRGGYQNSRNQFGYPSRGPIRGSQRYNSYNSLEGPSYNHDFVNDAPRRDFNRRNFNLFRGRPGYNNNKGPRYFGYRSNERPGFHQQLYNNDQERLYNNIEYQDEENKINSVLKVHISDDKEIIYDGEKTTVIKNHDATPPPPRFNRGRGPNFFRGRFRGRGGVGGGNRFPRNQLRRFDGANAFGNSGSGGYLGPPVGRGGPPAIPHGSVVLKPPSIMPDGLTGFIMGAVPAMAMLMGKKRKRRSINNIDSSEESELDELESQVKNHIQQFINKMETLTL